MREPIKLPSLSDTMETGRLIKWLKQPGDPVASGDALAELETDKAIMEVEAFRDGFMSGPLTKVPADLPVGTVIGYISDAPSTAQNVKTVDPETSIPATIEMATPNQEEANPVAVNPEAAGPASPYARGLARDLGIDLQQASNASDGVIHAAQVLTAALAGPAPDLDAGPAYRYQLFTPMHKAVASNMIATLGTPTFRVSARLPLAPITALAQQRKHSLTLLLARACALCVAKHPRFNAVYTRQALAIREQVDVGVAVDVAGGLLTPVLRDAAQRSMTELDADWRSLNEKIRRNRLPPEDYQGATFYLSNLGVFGQVSHFDALVPLGAAAIMALGAAHEGTAEFTLSCDHRVVFGADAARFLETLSAYLSAPETLAVGSAEPVGSTAKGVKT